MGIPGVVAVTPGGSRARGVQHAGSDWNFGLYYRGALDADRLREMGHSGAVADPGVGSPDERRPPGGPSGLRSA